MTENKKEIKKEKNTEEVILKKKNTELSDSDMDKVAGGAVGQDRTNLIDRKMEKI